VLVHGLLPSSSRDRDEIGGVTPSPRGRARGARREEGHSRGGTARVRGAHHVCRNLAPRMGVGGKGDFISCRRDRNDRARHCRERDTPHPSPRSPTPPRNEFRALLCSATSIY